MVFLEEKKIFKEKKNQFKKLFKSSKFYQKQLYKCKKNHLQFVDYFCNELELNKVIFWQKRFF